MEFQSHLNQEGGLNKEQNTSLTFLKLFVRAWALQSNRHLSVLLEAVLRTSNKFTLHQVFVPPKLKVTGLHTSLSTCSANSSPSKLMTAIVRKALCVMQHLVHSGVVEGKSVKSCTPMFCAHKMCKLLYDLTKHGDEQVWGLALKLQSLRFEMPREPHSTHVSICEEAKKKDERKKVQEKQGLEDGEIPVDKE